MIIRTDARRTSGTAPSAADLLGLQFDDFTGYAGTSEITPSVVSRRGTTEMLVQHSGYLASGKGAIYSAHVTINSPAMSSFISAEFGKINYVVFGYGVPDPWQHVYDVPRMTRGPEHGVSWATEAWATVPLGTDVSHISTGLEDLRNVVSAIRRRSPLQLSADVEELINQAAQTDGTPSDLDTWARRLAEDVRDLTD